MPDLSQLPVPLYTADMPYHWEYDNIPLETLANRDLIINAEVEIHAQILSQAIGTQGTLANRLAQSIDPDGNLIPAAVDQSEHNIAEHTDGTKTVTNDELTDYIELGFPDLVNPVGFVRMLASERDKLAQIADEATNITVTVNTPSNIVFFEEGAVELVESDSIQWEVEAPNKLKATLSVSTDFAHRHFYDLTPIMMPTSDIIPILNKLYKVTSTSTPYIEDSLRVYINGIRISKSDSVYYPNSSVTAWILNSYTEDFASGRFTLANPIANDDIIQIDFDEALV